MKITKSISFFAVFLTLLFAFTVSAQITAVAHIQNVGDKSFSGGQIGVAGRRLEGFSLKLDPAIPGLSLTYYCRLEGGDSAWLSEGDFCGTRGQGKGLAGIAIKLIGPEAKNYNVIYNETNLIDLFNARQASMGMYGCFNGISCSDDTRSLETFKVKIVKEPARPIVKETNNVAIGATAHFKDIGDRHQEGDISLPGDGLFFQLEGFSLNIPNIEGLGLQYMCHLQDSGDTAWLDAGQFCGTRGENRRLEGFRIKLTGPEANKYDVEYGASFKIMRATRHILRIVTPCANGGFAGARGQEYSMLSIEITLKRTKESKPMSGCSYSELR